ncbi:MAG: ATP-binding cassette domain-containing protein [Trueperaceae bacterium]|nr:ATP-binding cassette domain-containing protein [Trueperaceae bacterium]
MIEVEGLAKVYRVHEKEAGLRGSIRAFVDRRYRDVRAVDDVSFHVAPGEVVGFLGPNGAGKTTTLKVLSGLLHPSAGRVRVAGFEPRRRQSAFLRGITLVMGQKQQLSWDLAAVDSFLVNQAIYEIPDAVYRERLGELTEMLSLDGLLHKQVRKLSLGERMKCELAAALLHRPQVLFLDEPTIGLDVTMQQQVRRFVADYNARHGATVVLTSHYMADVTALAQRVLVIDHGRLVFDGDLKKLVEARAPERRVRLTFAEAVAPERFAGLGRLHRVEGLEVELGVPRADVARVAARALAELPVVDVAIEDVPVEDIVADLFADGRRGAEEARDGAHG